MMSSARSWRPMSLCARASSSRRCWRNSPARSAMRVVRSAAMRAVRLAVHQIDHRQPRGDLRARRALEPVIDLVLQQFARLIEQIDRDETIGETADHLVAAPADRRQIAKLIEHRQRFDRRQIVALSAVERSARTAPPLRPASGATLRSSAAAAWPCARPATHRGSGLLVVEARQHAAAS